jgi:hypothetical protein
MPDIVPEDLGGYVEPTLPATIMAELASLAQRVETLEVALDALRARLDMAQAPTR